tara:strand:+ start:282 stop:1514 length:1233 start_codon:yes stop_codon:yes gene_type:complete
MSSRYGGKIVTDGLVLCLDAHDAKSYAGEPTTNLVTSTAVDFSVRSTYSGNTFSQVADSESPSGYACEMSYTGTVNSASRCRFGAATNIPTSGTGFVSIWAKRSGGSSTTMRPKVYTGYAWYHLEPLDGGSIYFTDEYRPFGVAVTFGTNSGGPNPGFSMTHAGGSTENDKTRWIKPQVTTLSYNTPFANLSRSATDGWKDRTANSYDGTLVNMAGTGASHYKNGQVIMPVSASYLDFDGSNDYAVVTNGMNSLVGTSATTFAAWVYIDTVTSSWDGIIANKVNATEGIALLVSNTQKIFFQYDSTSGNYAIDGGSNIPTAEWTYIVGTYDTVAGYKTYMNGELNDSEADAGKSISSSGDMTINIGAQRNSSGNPGSYFPGRIAKVEIYNKALTAAEILQNYNATKGRYL